MALWRIRVAVEDRPGQLAAVVATLAGHGGNILGLSVHADAVGAVDEFVVEVPGDHRPLLADLGAHSRGSTAIVAVPAYAREVGDDTTRALLLTARYGSSPRQLPEALGDLLGAEQARWSPLTSPPPEFPEEPESVLLVPVGPLRGVYLRRVGRPFTWTESARADSLVRSIMPPAGPAPTSGSVVTHRGWELFVWRVGGGDAEALRRLHARCSELTLRRRYLSSSRELNQRTLEVFCDPERGLTLAARPYRAEEPVALAHLMYTTDPGVGEIAFLVEDSWHNSGIGTCLSRVLTAIAADWGLAEVRADTVSDNQPMQRVMRRLGATLWPPRDGVVQARLPVAGTVPSRRPGRLMPLGGEARNPDRSSGAVR